MKSTAKIAALVITNLAYGCGSDRTEPPLPDVYIGHAEGLFPAETLTDWVSYAGQLSEVTVVGEKELPPPASVFERKEGYIGRKVTLRIDQTLWRSPGATPAPAVVEVVVSGWLLKGERKIPFALLSSPRLEVGGRYVVPLVAAMRATKEPEKRTSRQPSGSTDEGFQLQWGPLSPDAVFESGGDPIATADVKARGGSALARKLARAPLASVASILAATAIDPVARKYWHLPPDERIKAVQADR